MHTHHRITGCLYACLLMLAACNRMEEPTHLPPTVGIEAATEVTRTSARLSGTVTPNGTGAVSLVRFRYGTTRQAEETLACDPSLQHPTVTLENLTPNTTYYYCLEAGNSLNTVASTLMSFTTQPNEIPTIGPLHRLNQGPLSITLQYDIEDNGGEPLEETGLCCRGEDGNETRYPAANAQGTTFSLRISGLQMNTSYIVQAYARNSMGEARSESYSFSTSQAVTVTAAGTLHEALGDEEKYAFTTLAVAGPLNGTDLRYLRDLMGRDVHGAETAGRLAVLNLTDATFAEGGESYDGMHYLAAGKATYGLFAGCTQLQRLTLPAGTTEIEENAFANCPQLRSIRIPAAVQSVAPSDNCPLLATIEVDEGNPAFSSHDGILYDRQQTWLYWHPEGKTSPTTLPAGLKGIGKHAFRNYRGQGIGLPEAVATLEAGVFQRAAITSIRLPEAVKSIPTGLFQDCTALTSVELGSRVEYLSEYCFDHCPLQHLWVKTENFPPFCQASTFAGLEAVLETCILHVPAGHRNIYRNDDEWGLFKHIVEEDYP